MSLAEKSETGKRSRRAATTELQNDLPPNSANSAAPTFPTMRPNAISTEVDIEQIEPWERNPRKHFSQEGLQELADSIRQLGLLEPIMLRMIPPPANLEDLPTPYTPSTCRYQIIGGERRWRAAKLAGLEVVPARVFEVGESVALEMALVENLQRQDLDPIEEAEGYRALQELGYTQTQIAQRVNRSQPAVANAVRLLKLPADVLERIRAKEISASHGIALLRMDEYPDLIREAAALVVRERLPVSALEGDFHNVARHFPNSAHIQALNWSTAFDWKQSCKSCPFGAFRKGSYDDGGYCLQPAHYKQLINEHNTKLQEAAKKQAEAIAKKTGKAVSGDRIPRLEKLPYNSYEQIQSRDCPSTCTEECPCRGAAIGYNDKLVSICTDPATFRKKKAEATRSESKDRRERFNGELERLDKALAQPSDDLIQRATAILIRRALSGVRAETFKKAAADLKDQKLADILLNRGSLYESSEENTWSVYAQYPPHDLIMLANRILVLDEIREKIEYKSDKLPRAEYLLAAKSSPSRLCSTCGLPPAECMCAELQKREQIAVASQDLTCPLCGAQDYGICKCDPDAVNAALVRDGRRAA